MITNATHTRKEPKIFESLNCWLCKVPLFSHTLLRSLPVVLACGTTLCRGCYFEEEKRMVQKHGCPSLQNCCTQPNTAHYIVEIIFKLRTDGYLDFTPSRNGYHLIKYMRNPVCEQCQQSFCVLPFNARLLGCTHMFCDRCCDRFVESAESDTFTVGSDYGGDDVEMARCPICLQVSEVNNDTLYLNTFKRFLEELPAMNSQFQQRQLEQTGQRVCSECNYVGYINAVFPCEECEDPVCLRCLAESKHEHMIVKNLRETLETMSRDLTMDIDEEFEAHERSFMETTRQIKERITTIQDDLDNKSLFIQQASNFADAKTKDEFIKHARERMEVCLQKYLEAAKVFNAEIEEISKER